MARRPLKGISRVRKLVRNLPDGVAGEVIVELYDGGRQLQSAIQAKAPVGRTRRLVSGITFKVLPRSLRLQVGYLSRRGGSIDPFYARIQDLGRKAQVVQVTRYLTGGRAKDTGRFTSTGSRSKATALTTSYALRVRAATGKRFVTGRFPQLRQVMKANLQGIFSRGLGKLSGISDE